MPYKPLPVTARCREFWVWAEVRRISYNATPGLHIWFYCFFCVDLLIFNSGFYSLCRTYIRSLRLNKFMGATCWPHEPCYQGYTAMGISYVALIFTYDFPTCNVRPLLIPPSINHFTVALAHSHATLIASNVRLIISPIGLVTSNVGRSNATARINHTGKIALMVLERLIQTQMLMILPLMLLTGK